jgi:hypothetical protein
MPAARGLLFAPGSLRYITDRAFRGSLFQSTPPGLRVGTTVNVFNSA